MVRRLLLGIVAASFSLINATQVFAAADEATVITGVASGDIGSPINGGNGKIYIADATNSKLFVVTAATDSVATIDLPNKPQTAGGALSISKDGTLLAVPLQNNNITIVNLTTNQVVATYSTGTHSVLSTAFSASNTKIFFSTEDTFDEVYLLDTDLAIVSTHFGFNSNLTWTGTDLQLETDSTGNFLYVLERYQSPGRLHKLNVATPEAPTFVAEDSHGTLGSNCRGFALLPAGVSLPASGDEAYLACGAPYYVQGIKQNGALLEPNTQFDTEEYPLGVEVLSNGDVVGVRDSNTGAGVRLFSNTAVEKKGWPDGGGSLQITNDGVAGTFVNDAAKIYTTNCGYTPSSSTNCKLWVMGGPTPSITITANKTKFTKKGGAIGVSATLVGGSISGVSAKLKKGFAVVKSKDLTLSGGVYTGNISAPKNSGKKSVKYSLFVTATIEGKVVTSNSIAITVTTKKK